MANLQFTLRRARRLRQLKVRLRKYPIGGGPTRPSRAWLPFPEARGAGRGCQDSATQRSPAERISPRISKTPARLPMSAESSLRTGTTPSDRFAPFGYEHAFGGKVVQQREALLPESRDVERPHVESVQHGCTSANFLMETGKVMVRLSKWGGQSWLPPAISRRRRRPPPERQRQTGMSAPRGQPIQFECLFEGESCVRRRPGSFRRGRDALFQQALGSRGLFFRSPHHDGGQ